MRIVVVALLLLAAHFCLIVFNPAPAGRAWIIWPFAADSKSWLGFVGGLPRQHGSVVTLILAAAAGLGFLVAAASLFWAVVPADWWPRIVAVSLIASTLLYSLYFGRWQILPLAVDLLIIWGLYFWNWSATVLRGF